MNIALNPLFWVCAVMCRFSSQILIKMKYEIGQKVWIKPVDAEDLEGVVIDFQKVEPYSPIVEFEYAGKKRKNSFCTERISPFENGKVKPVYVRVI